MKFPTVSPKQAGLIERPLPESVIQRAVMRRLGAAGWLVTRFNGGGFYGEPKKADRGKPNAKGQYIPFYIIQGMNASEGFPDLLALKGTRFILVETKTEEGKVSPEQQRFYDYAAHFGVDVYILRHPEAVDDLLEEIENGP